MSTVMPFEFDIPLSFFEKAEAPQGKRRRFGGVISTESSDRQGEVILQRGLNFNPFLKSGWFNDNHDKTMDGILGYPESVKAFKKGDKLPNGDTAKVTGTWTEGYMLGTTRANKVWELGQALKNTGRSLGFSVEGNITKRQGRLRKTIAEAVVKNVAITHCPVNLDSRLEILGKSLLAIENGSFQDQHDIELIRKALAMGAATGIRPPEGPTTGEGAGQIITGQSLEHDDDDDDDDENQASLFDNAKVKKSLSDGEAIAWMRQHSPNMSIVQAARFIEITRKAKSNGHL